MRSRKRLRHKRQGGTEERIPVRRLNAYLWPLRSGATWGNGGPHSGYRHLADKDEVPGSSPGRPTQSSSQVTALPAASRERPLPAWAALGPHAHPHRPAPWPLRALHPGRQAPRPPRTVVAHPARGRQPRGRCGHLALQPAPCPQRSRQRRRCARQLGLPGRSAVKRRRRRPPTPRSGSPVTPLTNARPRQRRPRPGLLGR
jgi:hypothetical protein